MKQKTAKAPQLYTEPEAVRRKLAVAYRKRSHEARWTEAEREAFARMADEWQRTLPEKNK